MVDYVSTAGDLVKASFATAIEQGSVRQNNAQIMEGAEKEQVVKEVEG